MRERAIDWLISMEGSTGGSYRCSSQHSPEEYPGMVLPATYNAAHALVLMGGIERGSASVRKIASVVNSFQREDGRYRVPGMSDDAVFKRPDPAYTWEYIDFHVGNYAIGAARNLGFREAYPLQFVEPYRSPQGLSRWLEGRVMDDPWMEGNNIVNLAGFYLCRRQQPGDQWDLRIGELLDWHDRTQDSQTGFWGSPPPSLDERRRLLVQMAGATHNFHIYYHEKRPIPRARLIVDASLSLAESELSGVTSACLDVDIVDVLANFIRQGYRISDIRTVLERKLDALLSFQNADGGFPDELVGVRRFDGWVRGYEEPQGMSNCFATWFRTAAIGMIACVLYPDTAADWTFRNTIGIGYYRITHE